MSAPITLLLGPTPFFPVVGGWLLCMIAVPLLARRGASGRTQGITIGVIAQAALAVIYLLYAWPYPHALRTIVAVPLLGWTAEFLGSRTGVPFGRYHYTEKLQPQIRRVPVVIPLAWLMMLPPAWAVAELVVPSGEWWVSATIAAAAFTAWDLYLDPHLVRWSFWKWEKPGRFYMGIPIMNFVGWFLWAWVITALVQPASLLGTPLFFVYTLTWLFQFGGHLVFWELQRSGLVGFAAMGLFIVLASRTLFHLVS